MGSHSKRCCSDYPKAEPPLPPPLILPTATYLIDEEFYIIVLHFPQPMNITQQPPSFKYSLQVNATEFADFDLHIWNDPTRHEINFDAYGLVVDRLIFTADNSPTPYKTLTDETYSGIFNITVPL